MNEQDILKSKINEYVLQCAYGVLKCDAATKGEGKASSMLVTPYIDIKEVNGILELVGKEVSKSVSEYIRAGLSVNAIFVAHNADRLIASVSQVNGTVLIHPHTLNGLDIYRSPELVGFFKSI